MKKNVKRSVKAGILAGIMFLSMSGCKAEEKEPEQNIIGYEDFGPLFNPLFNYNVKDENFIIFDVGDNDTVKTYKQDSKMKYCNEKDISFGIVITTDARTQDEIYKDVDYAKSIVASYNVDFPVYLNIDNIIESDYLMPDVMIKLITDFLQKCSSNGIFVGINGRDENLCRLKQISENSEIFSIDDYDVYLIKDGEEVKFDGSYTLVQNLNKTIKNLDTTNNCVAIDKNNLNSSTHFVHDSVYTLSEDDNIRDIANRFDLSTKELLDYNEVQKNDVIAGTSLKIPSSLDKTLPIETQNYERLDTPILGIDISHWQTTKNIDWKKVSQNVDFVILRCNYGTNKDKYFQAHYDNCIQNEIPVGVYCYNECKHVDDFESFKKNVGAQSNLTIESIKNKNITYPIYLDLENSNYAGVKVSELTSEELCYMLEDWITKINDYGGCPGLYCNESTYEDIVIPKLEKVGKQDLINKLQIWGAGQKGSNYYDEDHNIEEIKAEMTDHFSKEYSMHQSTSHGKGFGVNGNVDVDICFVNYEAKHANNGFSGYKDEEPNNYDDKFERDNWQKLYDKLGLAIGGISVAGLTAIHIKRKKRKKHKTK